jgi:hypothetical protein
MYYLIENKGNKIRASYKDLEDVVVNGFRVLNVPDTVSVDPTTFNLLQGSNDPEDELYGLIDEKWAGLLVDYPAYSYILGDELEDSTSWDISVPFSTHFATGNGVTWLQAGGGTPGGLETVSFDVSGDGIFDRFTVYWELYELTHTEVGDRTEIRYVPVDADMVNVSISNDGGTSFESAYHLQTVIMPMAGNQIRLRFENTSTTRYYLGSFAILY